MKGRGFSCSGKNNQINEGFTGCGKNSWNPNKCQGTTSQVAEKLDSMDFLTGFVSGHDFSRAERSIKINEGLSP